MVLEGLTGPFQVGSVKKVINVETLMMYHIVTGVSTLGLRSGSL